MSNNLPNSKIDSLIASALDDDLDDIGDLTTKSIIPKKTIGKVRLISKSNGIISGIPIFKRVYEIIDKDINLCFYVQDGEKIEKGMVLCDLNGCLHSIFKGERISLNFLQKMSGISTLTNKFVEKISHIKTKILDTRKTTPGYRFIEKYAVKLGGGVNHRFGLYDMILIKENHITAAGGIRKAVNRCLDWIKNKDIDIKIEVEVQNYEQIKEIINLPIDRVMLDNFSVASIQEAVKLIDHRFEVEVSGNIELKNVQKVAESGVDFISVGSITHSAKSLDMSMLLY